MIVKRRKPSGSFLSLLRRLTVLEFASWDLTASRLPEMKPDAIQVQQILLNLVRNASGSFTSQSGMPRILTIRTRALNQSMIIDVEDTGGRERDPEKLSKPSTAT